MRKNLILFITILIFTLISFSEPVNIQDVETVARNWFNEFANKSNTIDQVSLENYIYTVTFKDGGWVLVSADDVAKPVLAYGTSSLTNNNPAQQEWINNNYAAAIKAAVDSKADNYQTKQLWNDILNHNFASVRGKAGKDVTPLLEEIKWGQGVPGYNSMCPEEPDNGTGHGYEILGMASSRARFS